MIIQLRCLVLLSTLYNSLCLFVAGCILLCAILNLLDDGEVYIWGLNVTELHVLPTLIMSLHGVNVTQIACGGEHTLALTGIQFYVLSCVLSTLFTDKGKLYSWGRGKNGRNGHGHARTVKEPKIIKLLAGCKTQVISSDLC